MQGSGSSAQWPHYLKGTLRSRICLAPIVAILPFPTGAAEGRGALAAQPALHGLRARLADRDHTGGGIKTPARLSRTSQPNFIQILSHYLWWACAHDARGSKRGSAHRRWRGRTLSASASAALGGQRRQRRAVAAAGEVRPRPWREAIIRSERSCVALQVHGQRPASERVATRTLVRTPTSSSPGTPSRRSSDLDQRGPGMPGDLEGGVAAPVVERAALLVAHPAAKGRRTREALVSRR